MLKCGENVLQLIPSVVGGEVTVRGTGETPKRYDLRNVTSDNTLIS